MQIADRNTGQATIPVDTQVAIMAAWANQKTGVVVEPPEFVGPLAGTAWVQTTDGLQCWPTSLLAVITGGPLHPNCDNGDCGGDFVCCTCGIEFGQCFGADDDQCDYCWVRHGDRYNRTQAAP